MAKAKDILAGPIGDDYMAVEGIYVHENVTHVDLWYPRGDGPPKAIQVGLMDVRAADDIRIGYDFKRDGWIVSQARSRLVDRVGHWEEVQDWIEVGFFKAWAQEPNGEPPEY